MQIKMTLRSHLTPVRIAEVKNKHIYIVLLTNAGVDAGMDDEIGKHLLSVPGSTNSCSYEVWKLLKRLKTHDSAVLLSMYLNYSISYSRDIYSSMLITILFTIAIKRNKPRCP